MYQTTHDTEFHTPHHKNSVKIKDFSFTFLTQYGEKINESLLLYNQVLKNAVKKKTFRSSYKTALKNHIETIWWSKTSKKYK